MNIVDKLLKIDAGKLEMPKDKVKMFCKKLNTELEFEIQAIDPERAFTIQQNSLTIHKDGKTEIDQYNLTIFTILEGCSTLKDKKLLEHFKAKTPAILVNKLFLKGEVEYLYNAISKLSKLDDESEKDEDNAIKNLSKQMQR